MFFHIVIKWIYCESCKYVIKVKKYRTTQGADTPKQKAAQDKLIERWIRGAGLSPHRKPGKFYCPKCRGEAQIVDPPEPKPTPPPEIDIDKARQKYEALLKLKSVAPDSYGKYPDFDTFCDYLQKRRVQIIYDKRAITRIFIAGDNFKMDYALVP